MKGYPVMRGLVMRVGAVTIVAVGLCQASLGQDFFLADGQSWPGRILQARSTDVSAFFERSLTQPDGRIPKIRSITQLRDGRTVFCSGLDRSIMELTPGGERILHHGGYLARQVRTDSNGDLYWSGLETPIDGNPLPDGFIYKLDAATGQVHTLMTFSQGNLANDWWGAFDVRQGRVFVATLKQPSSIYEIIESMPRKLTTLPIGITAFRFQPDGSLLASDGRGKLIRFRDLSHPDTNELLLDSPVPFVDFVSVIR